MRPSLALRLGAFISLGALAVHQGRYVAGYGDRAEHALAAQGHAYLGFAGPITAVLLALACGQLIAHLAGGAPRPRSSPHFNRATLWLAFSSALLCIYTTQELLEGALSSGHPAGLGGAFGHGGWVAIGLSVVVGAIFALVAGSVARALARRAGVLTRFAWGTPVAQCLTSAPAPPVQHPLALRMAARGPPSRSA